MYGDFLCINGSNCIFSSFHIGFGLLGSMILAILTASLFIGIAIIIYRLNNIQDMLNIGKETTRVLAENILPKKVCQHCERIVEEDYESCPHCGRKVFKEYKIR